MTERLATSDADRALSRLGDEERELLRGWNETGSAASAGDTVHALFSRVAGSRPEAIAARHRELELDYGRLEIRSNRLAAHLRGLDSIANDDADVDFIVQASKSSIRQMLKDTFLPERPQRRASANLDAPDAPVAGARLGRDEAGNPAWYVEDPARPGTWRKLEDAAA